MSGDYTRQRHDPDGRVTATLLQQGRALLDADWNETVEAVDRRARAIGVDAMNNKPGQCLVPAANPDAFKIAVATTGALTIGTGRAYVDGMLVENRGDTSTRALDPVLGERMPESTVRWQDQPHRTGAEADLTTLAGPSVVYLEVWSREVGAAGDPGLLDPALGGADTAMRVQTAWRVGRTDDWAKLSRPANMRLNATLTPSKPAVTPCEVVADAGYDGPENRLYRVEIYAALPAGVWALWSDENAAVETAVATKKSVNGDWELTLHPRPAGRWNTLEPGNLVEFLDDAIEAAARQQGIGGPLLVVKSAGPDRVVVSPAPGSPNSTAGLPEIVQANRPRIRRWNALAQLVEGTPTRLDHGIDVTLKPESNGALLCRAGEYWTFWARTSLGTIDELKQAIPRGMRHLARLATLTPGSPPAVASDERVQWPPEPCDLPFHNRHLHGWGIVCGLQVECDHDAGARKCSLKVAAGYAIDATGHDVKLRQEQTLDLGALITAADPTLLSDGAGTVCLTIAAGTAGPVFKVEPYTKENTLVDLFDNTIWMDFLKDCVLGPWQEIQKELIDPADDATDPVISPQRRRTITILNVIIQFYNYTHGRHVFLSPVEHTLLEALYRSVRRHLRSETFCGLYEDAAFPEYPQELAKTGMSTVFGKGRHTRVRVHPDGQYVYTCGGGDTAIHVYDLERSELIAIDLMPSGAGSEVLDVAISSDGKRLYATAVMKDTDTILGLADLVDGRPVWRGEFVVLCDVRLVTLRYVTGGDSGTADLLHAIGLGRGLFALYPTDLQGTEKPRPQPICGFNAVGHMTVHERGGHIYATAVRGDGDPVLYDSIVVIDLRPLDEGGQALAPTYVGITINDKPARGDDDIAVTAAHVHTVAAGPQGTKMLLSYRIDAGVGLRQVSTYELEDTVVRLAAHPETRGLLVTLEDSYRMTVFDPNKLEPRIVHVPLQISPVGVAVEKGVVVALNGLSTTLTLVPHAALTRNEAIYQKLLAELVEYRSEVIKAFVHLVGGVLQYLKDCFCHHLLISCPKDEEKPLYLACVEVRDNRVYRICNFSKRKYVKTFPAVDYWMSVIPVAPLVQRAVEWACCAILPQKFLQHLDKFVAGKKQMEAKTHVKGRTIRDALLYAKLRDRKSILAARKTSLDVYRRIFVNVARERIRNGGRNKAGASKQLSIGMPAEAARAALAERKIAVERVEAFDAKQGGFQAWEYLRTPPQLAPGSRVIMHTHEGKVLYYAPAPAVAPQTPGEPTNPELEAEVERLRGEIGELKEARQGDAEAFERLKRNHEAMAAETGRLRDSVADLRRLLESLDRPTPEDPSVSKVFDDPDLVRILNAAGYNHMSELKGVTERALAARDVPDEYVDAVIATVQKFFARG